MPDNSISDILETIGNLDYDILKDFLWKLSEKISIDEESVNVIQELMAKQNERNKKPYGFLK